MAGDQIARGVKRKRFPNEADGLYNEVCSPTARRIQHEPSSQTTMDLCDDNCHTGLQCAQPVSKDAETAVNAEIQEACFGSVCLFSFSLCAITMLMRIRFVTSMYSFLGALLQLAILPPSFMGSKTARNIFTFSKFSWELKTV